MSGNPAVAIKIAKGRFVCMNTTHRKSLSETIFYCEVISIVGPLSLLCVKLGMLGDISIMRIILLCGETFYLQLLVLCTFKSDLSTSLCTSYAHFLLCSQNLTSPVSEMNKAVFHLEN